MSDSKVSSGRLSAAQRREQLEILVIPKNLIRGEDASRRAGIQQGDPLQRNAANARTRRENTDFGPWRIEVARNATTQAWLTGHADVKRQLLQMT